MERWPNYKLYAPKKFPFKQYALGGILGLAGLYFYREHNRRTFMRNLRARNQAKIEQSRNIEQSFSANIKDFQGNAISLDDQNYEYKFIYYGDFQTFFQLYTQELEELNTYRIKNIFLTDSSRIKDIMDNIMKVKLKDTWYAFEEDTEVIKESGITKDHLYVLNDRNDVVNSYQVVPKDALSIQKAIQATRMKIRKDLDRRFLRSFDFNVSPKKEEGQ